MADQDIQRALQAEPTLSIPADIMPATTGPQGQALAETLERDGYDAQAKQILLQVIEKDPGIQLDPQDQAILRQVGSSVESEIWHVIINPVFLAGFLIGLLVMLSLYSRLRRRLHFQPFDAGNDNDAGPGPAATLRELIRAEVHRLAAEARLADGRKLRLDQAGPYEADCDLGKVSDGMPDVWKPIVSVTGMIMKTIGSKARLVTGMLLPGGSVAMGMETVNGVVKHKSVIQNEELGFPPPDRDILAQLALPAAAWIILSYDPCARLGGTSQWESYVAFAAGYAWQEKGDMLRAKECYKRACNNPDNLAAAVNLAALEQREERQAQQVSPVDRQSYKRLSELVRNPYIPASDVQWYRSRYLLSTGLRDAWDRPDGGIAVVPEPGQRDAVYGEALRHAAELALELERKAAAPGSLPEPFVAYGRAAALTLVARQAVQTTSDLHKVVTDAAQVPEYDEVSVRNALGNVLAGKPDVGTAERLMTFVRWHLPVDDQAQYNMYRFHRTRAANLAATIAGWDSLLADAERTYGASPPDHVRKWERDIQLWREGLAELREDEMVQMKEFADQVVAAQDPILAERVTTLREADPEGRPPAEAAITVIAGRRDGLACRSCRRPRCRRRRSCRRRCSGATTGSARKPGPTGTTRPVPMLTPGPARSARMTVAPRARTTRRTTAERTSTGPATAACRTSRRHRTCRSDGFRTARSTSCLSRAAWSCPTPTAACPPATARTLTAGPTCRIAVATSYLVRPSHLVRPAGPGQRPAADPERRAVHS